LILCIFALQRVLAQRAKPLTKLWKLVAKKLWVPPLLALVLNFLQELQLLAALDPDLGLLPVQILHLKFWKPLMRKLQLRLSELQLLPFGLALKLFQGLSHTWGFSVASPAACGITAAWGFPFPTGRVFIKTNPRSPTLSPIPKYQ